MAKSIKNLLTRGVEEIIVAKELEKKIISGKKLRIKHGVDPTSKDLHIGYAIVYHKLREFQKLGHKIIFLIGDFTARFGDPTDKEKTRNMRDKKEVREMAKNYIEQVGKILDLKKTEIRYNSEWYDKMNAEELLHLMSRFTNSQMLERDMFSERIKKKKEIQYHEPVYPMLQGWDSVMLKSDLTIIGTDQKFNELQARKLQQEDGQKPQDIITVPLLIGVDGVQKMSQSLGNYIGITESAKEQFGKVMSIPDKLIYQYFELATQVSDKELLDIKKELASTDNPKNLKVRLAKEIVKMYHNEEEANNAEAEFNRVFVNREIPNDILEVKIKKPVCESLASLLVDIKLAPSKSEARRLISQGAVKIDNAKITEDKENLCLHNNMIIKVGKRKFVKIKIM